MKSPSMSCAALIVLLGLISISPLLGDGRPASTRYAVAIESGDSEAIERLLDEGHGPETPIEYGERRVPPLVKAAWEGQTEIAEILLEHGANVDAIETGGTTPLMQAITRGWDDMVDLLLEAGADPTVLNTYQQDALQGAIHADRPDWVERLVEAGAKLAPNAYGHTPLMTAAAGSSLDCIDYFVDQGADVNAKSQHGGTALTTAAITNQPKAVRALLENGADPSIADGNGTAMEVAEKYGYLEIVEILKAAEDSP